MKIIGSLTSPYVRITRALAEELSLSYELVQISTMLAPTPEEAELVKNNNPLIRVPVLQDSDNTIFDSRIICNYLINKENNISPFNKDLTIEQENAITAILGICESAIVRIIFSHSTDLDLEEGYLKHSLDRVANTLNYLNSLEDLGKEFGLPELALICTIEFLEKRKVIEWRTYKNIETIYETYKDRPSLVKTSIPTDT
ncbi:MAG: glutathione S-transferase family protein [Alphaproteobacteria bacterium]